MPASQAANSVRAESNSVQADRGRPGRPADPGQPRLTRVHFTAGDLALTRFCAAPMPLVEAMMGLVQLKRRRPGVANSRWASQARLAFPATARLLLDLIPKAGCWPDFLSPVVTDLDEGLALVQATPRQVLREQVATSWHRAGRPPPWLRALADGDREARKAVQRSLRDYYDACVAPHWPMIVASFRSDVSRRVEVLAGHGLAGALGTLHEDLAWRDQSLERPGWTGDHALDGTGLQIVPCALWAGPPWFSMCSPNWENALIYPARPAGGTFAAGGARDLTGLLGRTRAAALRALRDPCSTSELAARLGISAPSASEHATALRDADLVHTVRRGRGVRHSLTPLGRSLLNGQPSQAGGRDLRAWRATTP